MVPEGVGNGSAAGFLNDGVVRRFARPEEINVLITDSNFPESLKEKIKEEISLRKEYVELLDLEEDYIDGTITITVKAEDEFYFDFLVDVFKYDGMRLTKEKDDNKIIIYSYTKK